MTTIAPRELTPSRSPIRERTQACSRSCSSATSRSHSLGGRLILAGECGYSAIEFLHQDGGLRRAACTDGVVFTELTPPDAAGQLRALDAEGRPLPGSAIPVARLRAAFSR
jgi:hypothetical protein